MAKSKAWLPFAGELLLPRVVRLIAQVVRPVVVVAAKDQELPDLPREVAIVHDDEPDRGPFQGLVAGLAALQGRVDTAFVSACDVPFLRPAFVQKMIDLLGNSQACVPFVDGFQHPLATVYRLDVLPIARTLLANNRCSLVKLLEKLRAREVSAEELHAADPNLDSLRNVNTPEDYERALRDATTSIT